MIQFPAHLRQFIVEIGVVAGYDGKAVDDGQLIQECQ